MSGCASKCQANANWKRTPQKLDDPNKSKLLAKRYQQALDMAKNEQAQQIDPRSLAISRSNRQFNALHVHNVILKSIARDGHDPSRPHVGICVEVTDPAQLKDLVEYNEELTNNSDLMPPSA